MTTKTLKDAAGKALYLEFRQGMYTFQTILVPATQDLSGNIVPAVYIRRRISEFQPRKKWHIDKSMTAPLGRFARDEFTGNFKAIADPDALKDFVGVQFAMTTYQFSQLIRQAWTLYKKPLAVEFSYEDLETLKSGKIANGLYRRIERSRLNQGWDASLISTTTSTPSTSV